MLLRGPQSTQAVRKQIYNQQRKEIQSKKRNPEKHREFDEKKGLQEEDGDREEEDRALFTEESLGEDLLAEELQTNLNGEEHEEYNLDDEEEGTPNWAKELEKEAQKEGKTVARRPSADAVVYYLSFQGYESRHFGQWVEKICLKARLLPELTTFGPVSLPTRSTVVTPIRGPFKDKTGQEHWARDRHRRFLRIEGDSDVLERFILYVKGQLEPVVAMRITRHQYWSLDRYFTTPSSSSSRIQ